MEDEMITNKRWHDEHTVSLKSLAICGGWSKIKIKIHKKGQDQSEILRVKRPEREHDCQ